MSRTDKGFTGRHMLLTTCAFFAVVISVNVTMAWFASASWSGLVVENTYVASQQFNQKASAIKAMAATGVSGDISLRGNVFTYNLHNRDGSPAPAEEVTAAFRRPVGDHEDFTAALKKVAVGRFEVDHHVPSGDWIVELISKRDGMTILHEALRFDTAEFVR
ncbi:MULTISPECIES: FixH family protein [Rhizobium]|uniref:FixH family protein n=1 Tax=Rhizobium TaxID=379 RepID=UPI0014413260|nr:MULTISPECIES: FixH family protein [Rhizobium]MBY3380939.1 cation transporter [Rhizobium laguerreae]MBY5814553.1 cation transporter [Rhizobium leguminosarum]MBY5838532.1 cation transporter [Rhizobium leguminosarum]NKM76663.1 cation transporter [Rhizobium leguminosarum bv. viciae]QSZ07553.1 FixH family protein [Rhizobium leguminosarum]